MPAPSHFGPFKAAQSYGPADDLIFHGRDADGASVARFMADRPFSILTAPSGTGKTSLLHARVIPTLEGQRWMAVYARPRSGFDRSLRQALCQHLLPDLKAEIDALDQMLENVPGAGEAQFGMAIAWYHGLSKAQRAEFRHFVPLRPDDAAPLPMICRLLRGSVTMNDFIEYYEAVSAHGSSPGITALMSLRELSERLKSAELKNLWIDWHDQFRDTGDLAQALTLVHEEWIPLRPGITGIVLILDQVEELFTQFPAGAFPSLLAEIPRWQASATTSLTTPVNVALSMRKEFFADVVPHLQVQSIKRVSYFLQRMSSEQARAAFGQSAGMFGVHFEASRGMGPEDCLGRVLALTVEPDAGWSADINVADEEVQYSPALISLIGAHLWIRLEEERCPVPVTLTWEQFTELIPETNDVFTQFLDRSLRELEGRSMSDPGRFDALELLDHLATSSGYRNIVAQDELIARVPLPREVALQMLRTMDEQLKLIRTEVRGRTHFIEIMHEGLIGAVRRLLAEVKSRDMHRAVLALAYDTINMLPDDPDPIREPSLGPHLRDALAAYLDRVNLNRLSSKHLLRSLLCAGPPLTDFLQPSNRRSGSENWRRLVLALASRLDDASRDNSRLIPLLSPAEIDRAIENLEEGQQFDGDRLRHLTTSVLAERSDRTGPRIRRLLHQMIKR